MSVTVQGLKQLRRTCCHSEPTPAEIRELLSVWLSSSCWHQQEIDLLLHQTLQDAQGGIDSLLGQTMQVALGGTGAAQSGIKDFGTPPRDTTKALEDAQCSIQVHERVVAALHGELADQQAALVCAREEASAAFIAIEILEAQMQSHNTVEPSGATTVDEHKPGAAVEVGAAAQNGEVDAAVMATIKIMQAKIVKLEAANAKYQQQQQTEKGLADFQRCQVDMLREESAEMKANMQQSKEKFVSQQEDLRQVANYAAKLSGN